MTTFFIYLLKNDASYFYLFIVVMHVEQVNINPLILICYCFIVTAHTLIQTLHNLRLLTNRCKNRWLFNKAIFITIDVVMFFLEEVSVPLSVSSIFLVKWQAVLCVCMYI